MLGQKTYFQDQRKKNLEWSDVKRMSVFERKGHDPKWIPTWALDDRKVRRVVYDATWRYARHKGEARLNVQPGMSLMALERLAKNARENWNQEIARTVSDKCRKLVGEHLRTTERGYATRLVAILYMSYRTRLKATDIAEQLEMTPVSVRQILYRMNNIARRLFGNDDQFKRHWTERGGTNKRKKYATSRRYITRSTPERAPKLYKEMAAFFNSGVMLRELSSVYGMKIGTIHAALLRYKLVNPDRPPNHGCFVKDFYRAKGTDFDA